MSIEAGPHGGRGGTRRWLLLSALSLGTYAQTMTFRARYLVAAAAVVSLGGLGMGGVVLLSAQGQRPAGANVITIPASAPGQADVATPQASPCLGAWVRKGQQADGGLGVPQRDGLGT